MAPAFGRRIPEFKASLVYRVNSRTDSQNHTEKPCLEKRKKKKEREKGKKEDRKGNLTVMGR